MRNKFVCVMCWEIRERPRRKCSASGHHCGYSDLSVILVFLIIEDVENDRNVEICAALPAPVRCPRVHIATIEPHHRRALADDRRPITWRR